MSGDLARDLQACGISSVLIEGWERRGFTSLLPFQKRMARDSTLRRGGNFMVVAPTSSGKTLLAEIAMAMHLSQGRRAIYLVPTKALAEEKLACFEQWLAPSRHRVLCASRDRPETDPKVGAGEFDLLVAVYEKMNHYLLTSPEILDAIGIVVVDEIQMLADADRGGLLDLLLTKIRRSPRRVQIVALASALSDASDLAGWLGCELCIDRRRPRELREGILDASTGEFRYSEVDSETEGTEALAEPAELEALTARMAEIARAGGDEGVTDYEENSPSPQLFLLAAAAHLARRGEQALVFAPTRRLSCLWARLLAELELEAPPARVALARLTHQEPTRSIASMRFCFERGVAFHNADLHSGLRHLIEQAFNEGQLRVIVCTPTLGQGVNLAARNVLQFPWRIQSRSGSGRPYTLRLGRSRFSNQGGRAARFGLGENEGRSMVVAATTGEAQQFWNELMEGKDEATDLPLISMTLPSIVLDLLTACPRKTTLDVRDALRGTYSALRAELSRLPLFSTGGPGEVEDALDRLSHADLIRWDPAASAWAMTGLGEVAVCQGLSIATVAYLRRELEEGIILGQLGLGRIGLGEIGAPLPLFEIYLALALTEEGREASSGRGLPRRRFLPPLSRGEEPGEDPGEINELDSPLPRSFFKQPGGTSREQIMALNAASILTDWVHGVGTEELEARYGVQYGSLANLAAQFVWLLRALAGIAAVLRRPRPVVEGLQRLAERTLLGIPEEGVDLARLRVLHLGRGAIQKLLGEGCSTPEDLAGAGCEYLARLVGQDLAKQLEGAALKAIEARRKNSEARGRIAGERSPTIVQEELPLTRGETPAPPPSSLPIREDHLLEINLQSPGIIQARGKEVFLPPLSFELLAAMAERPGEVVTRLALYMRLWPEGGPEDQQLDEHRRNLLRRLRPALGDRTESIFEVVRGIGFRLALSPEQVGLRR